MNDKLKIAFVIMFFIFHIITHSWLFNDIEEKNTPNQVIASFGLGVNIIFLLFIFFKLFKMFKKNKATVSAPVVNPKFN